MSKSPRRLLTAIALLTAIGCGGGDDTGPTGSVTLSASPSSLTVQQGGSGTVTVTLVRGGGFADPVNVAVTGLPSGVTLSVTPAQLTGATTQAVVTVNVANTVPAGTYTATVSATATGIGTATATYSLTVTALPTFALTATPAALSIGQGGSSTTNIGVVRTNFTGAVALALVSPPAGITGSFNPTPATADQSVLTINVAGTVATGNYTLTVNGSSAGQTDKTTTVTVTVTPPPDYSISATPATVPINAGSNATTTVNITRTNFTGAVNLALDAPPAGITATFNPASPTGNSSVATINVASTVVVGNYNVTIKGTATGVPTNVAEAVDEASAAGDRTTVVVVQVALAPNFTIAASPAVNTTPGGSGSSTVTIVRTNLTADVALSLVSPPAGITGVFTPATLTGATLTSTLAITVAGTVAPGSYNVTVQGVGGGLTKTVVLAVTVATGPSVTFSMSPTSLTLEQGAAGSANLSATRSNFTGNITPTVTGQPNGMTVTVTPNPITGNTATVNVSVGSGVAPGPYTLTITGNTGGTAGTPTTTLGVTVTQATGNNYSWEFCSNNVPLKFWRLSGGTWTEVAPTVVATGTRFSFTLSGGSAGVAWTASASGFSNSIVYFAQATELGSFVGTCTTPSTVPKTFNLSGQVGGEAGQLGYGGAAAVTGAAASYNLNVVPGTYDWLWAFGSQSGIPPTTDWTNYRIGRNEASAAGAVNVNRAGAPAFVTAPFSFTGGAAGSFWQTTQSLQGANGFVTSLSIGSLFTGTGSGNMLFPQAGDRLSTDLWLLSATNIEFDQSGKGDSRSSSRYIGSAPPGSLTFALPGKVPAFTVSTVGGASIPWAAAGSIPAEYQNAAGTISATFQGAGSNAIVTLIGTRAWLVANAMSTNFTLTGPTLPNFLPAWAPGAPLAGTTVTMTGTNLTTGPVAGGFLNSAARIQ